MNLRLPLLLNVFCIICWPLLLSAEEVIWPRFQLVETEVEIFEPADAAPGTDADSLYIATRDGYVYHVNLATEQKSLFLDISSQVEDDYDLGLRAIALDPGFATNGEFYAYYVRSSDSLAVLSRFTLANNQAIINAGSEEVLLVIDGQAWDRQGDGLVFGPDGYLYLAVGDGNYPQKASDLTSLRGKILRIDVSGKPTYEIPDDNPFVNNPSAQKEIWALGLRNPGGFSFDEAGNLYLPDRGSDAWNSLGEEEWNIIPAGQSGWNLGWPFYEGFKPTSLTPKPPDHRQPAFTTPVYSGSSGRDPAAHLIRGYVYDGPAPPGDNRFDGVFLFGDRDYGDVYAAKLVEGEWIYKKILRTVNPQRLVRATDGTLYVLSSYHHAILKLQPRDSLHPPGLSGGNTAYYEPREIEVSNISPGIKMHYTWENRLPTESDPFVTAGQTILINRTGTLRARALHPDFAPSELVEREYTLIQRQPEITYHGTGVTYQDLEVHFTNGNPDARFHYRFDGQDPTEIDPYVLAEEILVLDQDMQLRVRAFADLTTPSSVYSRDLTFYCDPPGLPWHKTVPAGTVVEFEQSLTPDAISYYTTDGTQPTTQSLVLPDKLVLEHSSEVRVLTTNGRYEDYNLLRYYGVMDHLPNRVSILFAGQEEESGYVDGAGEAARFTNLFDITHDAAGNLFVADNRRIRRIDPDGNVTTFAGTGVPARNDGPRLEADILQARSLRFNTTGDLYFLDGGLRGIDASGQVTTVLAVGGSPYDTVLRTGTNGTMNIMGRTMYTIYEPGETSHQAYTYSRDIMLPAHTGVAPDGTVYGGNAYGLYRLTGENAPEAVITNPFRDCALGDGNSSGIVPSVKSAGTMIWHGDKLYFANQNYIRVLENGRVRTVLGAENTARLAGYGPTVKMGRAFTVAPDGTIYFCSATAVYKVLEATDADGDGFADELETQVNGLSTGTRDDMLDSDNDGFSNTDEALLGMDLLNPDQSVAFELVNYGQPNWLGYVEWPDTGYGMVKAYYSRDLVNWHFLGSNGTGRLPANVREESPLFLRAIGENPMRVLEEE